MDIGDKLLFNFKVDQTDSLKVISGNLRTNAFKPIVFTALADSQFTGKIDSDIDFSGFAGYPNASGFIRMDDGFIFNNGPYAGLFEFAYDSTGFNLSDFNFEFCLLDYGIFV